MSLKVWLPFTSNLTTAHGIHNTSVTTSNVTLDTSGKLGRCAYFSGSSSYIQTDFPTNIGTNDFSISLWLKIPTISSGSYFTICTSKTTAAASVGFGIYWNYSQKKFLWSTADGSGATEIWMDTAVDNIVYDKWIHLVMVRNSSDAKKGYFYINGIRYELASVPVIRNIATATNLGLGRTTNGSYYTKMYINDFRVYDHALSVREVKEIAQGLVCHYKLSGVLDGLNFNQLKATAKSYSPPSYCGYQLEMTENLVAGETYTLQLWDVDVSHSAKTEAQLGIWIFWGGGSVMLGSWAGTDYFTNGHADYLVKTFTVTSSQAGGSGATNAWFNMYNSVGYVAGTMNMSIGRWKLEKGSIATGYTHTATEMGIDSTRLVDSSGNGYVGTQTTGLTTSSSTGRYSASTVFSNGNYVQVPNLYPSGYTNTYTISCWANYGTTGMLFGHQNGNRLNLWMNNNNMYWNTGDSYNNPFGVDCRTYAGAWHHFVVTGDGTTTKLYIDGEFKANATTFRPLTGTTLILNGWDTSNAYDFNGSMSDFRLYATTFTADDVAELYRLSGHINKDGSLHVYEVNETSTESKLTFLKTGVLQISGNTVRPNLVSGTTNPVIASACTNYESGQLGFGSGGDGVSSVTIEDVPVGKYSYNITGNTSGNRDFQQYVPYIAGQKYTGSWWAKGSGTLLYRSWDATAQTAIFTYTKALTDTWTFYSYTFTATQNQQDHSCTFHLGCTGNSEIHICGMKLEQGDSPTPWVTNHVDTVNTGSNPGIVECNPTQNSNAAVTLCKDYTLINNVKEI